MSKTNSNYFGFSIGIVAAVVLVVVVVNALVGSALKGGSSGEMSEAAIAERIKPVGQLNTGAPMMAEAPAAPAAPAAAAPAPAAPAAPAAAAGPRSGQDVYNSTCFVCHGMGIAGAPKLGDKAAWGPRIAQGMDTLVQHAINGFQGNTGVMPARGTCAACSDAELKAAVEYMVGQSK